MEVSKRKQRRMHRALKRRKPKAWCLVYCLKHDGKIFYVGQTRQLPEQRLRWHFKEIWKRKAIGKNLSPAQRWLDSLGFKPEISVLDREGIWDISEAVWIDRCRRDGHPLLNVISVVQ